MKCTFCAKLWFVFKACKFSVYIQMSQLIKKQSLACNRQSKTRVFYLIRLRKKNREKGRGKYSPLDENGIHCGPTRAGCCSSGPGAKVDGFRREIRLNAVDVSVCARV
uniref:(northern house mosquito) hypothetical protein n=1 Tax=Culex pipiens TaxID=7175 RepID=A0A8D8L707_CULPI